MATSLVALTSIPALADRLVILNSPASIGLGGASSPFAVQRQLDTGAPLTPASPLAVRLATDSARGQFSLAPAANGSWTQTLDVTIPGGQSASPQLYYRDGAPDSTAGVTASATAFTSALALVPVGTTIVADSVETGSVYVNEAVPGSWNDSWLPVAQNSITASTSAAHWGTWGLRVNDAMTNPGAGGQNNVFFTTPPIVGDVYIRAWVRLTVVANRGAITIGQLTSSGVNGASLVEVDLEIATRSLHLAGFDSATVFRKDSTDAGWSPGLWHLVEFAALGIGSNAGKRRAWLDGKEIYALDSIDWSGLEALQVAIGEPWADDRTFAGQIDFDDVRAGSLPPASRLAVASPLLVAGDCHPLGIGLVGSGALAVLPAPYGFTGAVTCTGAATFSDPSCAVPSTTFTFLAGDAGAAVWIRAAAPGPVQVLASYIDFLPGIAAFAALARDGGASDGGSSDPDAGPVVPDAGPDAGPVVPDAGELDAGPTPHPDGGATHRRLTVGCDCDVAGSGGVGLGLGLGLMTVLRRPLRSKTQLRAKRVA